jgi:hypothetical protein
VPARAHDLPVACAIADDRDPGRARLVMITPRGHLPPAGGRVELMRDRQGDGG